jgi:shikimate kinase
VSVLNAIPTGIGCAFGVDMPVLVDASIRSKGIDQKKRDPLIRACIEMVSRHASRSFDPSCIDVRVSSSIPRSMGLKSSSAVSNAVCLALNELLSLGMDRMECLNLAVDASIAAGVTVTGAFDDACASMFGRACVTDNVKRKIIADFEVPPWLILVLIPKGAKPRPKSSIDVHAFKKRKKEYLRAVELALDGDLVDAMRINGLLTAEVVGDDIELINKVIDAGALAGGTTGTGPAMAFVFDEKDEDVFQAVRFLLRKIGKVICTKPARGGAIMGDWELHKEAQKGA